MGWLRELAQSATLVSGTTLVLTVGAGGAAVGTTVCVAATGAAVGNRTVSSIVDSRANSYSRDVNVSSAASPLCLGMARITTALVPGDTITLTFSLAMTAMAACAHAFDDVSGAAVDTFQDQVSSGTALSSSATTTTATANELLFGAAQVQWNATAPSDDFTATGSFTELAAVLTTGAGSVHRALFPMYRYVTGTGAYAATGTIATARAARTGIATYAVTPITPPPSHQGKLPPQVS